MGAGNPRVGIVMGSISDLPTMREAAGALEELGVDSELRVISAHRTPLDAIDYARSAEERGLGVIIAGAGGAAHLAGVLASATLLPVIGVPIPLANLGGLDSLLSTVQMPAGIPVATVSVGGARNAGLLAGRILAISDPEVRKAVELARTQLAERTRAADASLRAEVPPV